MKLTGKRLVAILMLVVLSVFTFSDFATAFAKSTQFVTLENTSGDGALLFDLETFDANTKEVLSGDTVKLYAAANDGYLLDTIKVYDTTNKKSIVYNVSMQSYGVYEITFKMPRGNITVSATYTLSNIIHETIASKVDSTEMYIKSNIDTKYSNCTKFEPTDILTVRQTLVDGSKLDTKTIDGLWAYEVDATESSILDFSITNVILFNLDDNSEYLVGFANTLQGDNNSVVKDHIVAELNDDGIRIDDTHYDYSTGLVYIPKSTINGLDENGEAVQVIGGSQMQLLQVYNSDDEDVKSNVYVRVNNDGVKGLIADTGYFEASIHEKYISILLAKDSEARASLENADICVNINAINVSNDMWSYDIEQGVLVISLDSIQSEVIDIYLTGNNVQEPTVAEALLNKMGMVALADGYSDYFSTDTGYTVFRTYHTVNNDTYNPYSGTKDDTPVRWTFSAKPAVGDYFEITNGSASVTIDYAGDDNYYNGNKCKLGTFILGSCENDSLSSFWNSVYNVSSTNDANYFNSNNGVGATDAWTVGKGTVSFKVGFNNTSNSFDVKNSSGNKKSTVTFSKDEFYLMCAHVGNTKYAGANGATDKDTENPLKAKCRIIAVGQDNINSIKQDYILVAVATTRRTTQNGVAIIKLAYSVTETNKYATVSLKKTDASSGSAVKGAVYGLFKAYNVQNSQTDVNLQNYAGITSALASSDDVIAYSGSGGTYGLLTDAIVGYFITDANGSSHLYGATKATKSTDIVLNLGSGGSASYRLVELWVPAGYKRDSNVYSFTLNANGNQTNTYAAAVKASTVSNLKISTAGTNTSLTTNTNYLSVSNNTASIETVLSTKDSQKPKYVGLRLNKFYTDGSTRVNYGLISDSYGTECEYTLYSDSACTNVVAKFKSRFNFGKNNTGEYHAFVSDIKASGLSSVTMYDDKDVLWGLKPDTNYYLKETTVTSGTYNKANGKAVTINIPSKYASETYNKSSVVCVLPTFGTSTGIYDVSGSYFLNSDVMNNILEFGSVTVEKKAGDGAAKKSQAGAVFNLYYSSVNSYPSLNITTNTQKTSRTVTITGANTYLIGTFTLDANGNPVPSAKTVSIAVPTSKKSTTANINSVDYTPTVSGTTFKNLPLGYYTLVEVKAPTNGMYRLPDDNRRNKVIDKTNYTALYTFPVSDPPVGDPISIEIDKSNENGKDNAESLAGAVFEVKFYSYATNDAYLTKDNASSKTPTYTWYLETKLESNGKYIAGLDADHISKQAEYLNKSSEIPANSNLPVGTVVIKEVKAAPDYDKDSGTLSANGVTYSDRVFIGWIKPDSTSDSGASLFIGNGVNAANATVKADNLKFTVTNKEDRGDLLVQKNGYQTVNYNGVDYEVEVGTVANARFILYVGNEDIYSNNGTVAIWEGITLTANTKVTEAYTDKNGQFTVERLPKGSYVLVEEVAPFGWEVSASVDVNMEEGDTTVPVMEGRASSSLTLNKKDSVSDKAIEGATYALLVKKTEYATFSKTVNGTKINLLGASLREVTYDGTAYVVLQENITDENGQIEFESLDRNANYFVRETKAPAGYYMDTNVRAITLDKTDSYSNSATVKEDKIEFSTDATSNVNAVNQTGLVGTTVTLYDIIWFDKNPFTENEVTYTLKTTFSTLDKSKTWDMGERSITKDELVYDNAEKKYYYKAAFELDTTDMQGKTVVMFEYLYQDGKLIHSDDDIANTKETLYFPDITTTLKTTQAYEGSNTPFTDTVELTNLIVGQKYVVKSKLYNKTDKTAFEENGSDVLATKTFTADKTTMTVDCDFKVNTMGLGDDELVCYEYLYIVNADGTETPVVKEEDLSNAAQMKVLYTVPELPSTGSSSSLLYGIIAAFLLLLGTDVCVSAMSKKKDVTVK